MMRSQARTPLLSLALAFACLSLLSLAPTATEAYSTGSGGSPCTGAVAGRHRPRHGPNAWQTTPSPYEVRLLGGDKYEVGKTYELEIRATDGEFYFNGFMMTAFADDGTGAPGTTRLGTWQAGGATNPDSMHVMCDASSTLIHSNADHRINNTFLWTPTQSAGAGRVYFEAGITRDYATFWRVVVGPLDEQMPSHPVNPTSLVLTDVAVQDDDSTSATLQFPAAVGQKFLVNYYGIEMAQDGPTPQFAPLLNVSLNVNATQYTPVVTGLPANSSLVFRVRACHRVLGCGEEQSAPMVRLTTSSFSAPLPSAPVVPAGAKSPLGTVRGGRVELDFTPFIPDPSGPALVGFTVQIRVDNGEVDEESSGGGSSRRLLGPAPSPWDEARTELVGPDQTSYDFGALNMSVPYLVRFNVRTARGVSPWSAPLAVTVTSMCANACSGRGQCTTPDNVCNCEWGWLGADCSLPSRIGANGGSKGPQCYRDRSFCMDFAYDPTGAVDPGHVTFRLISRSHGYAGLLFDAPDGMTGGTGYMLVHRFGATESQPGTSMTSTVYSPGLYDPVAAPDDMSVKNSLQTWANATHVEYIFRKAVQISPQIRLDTSGYQDVAWAFGQAEADDHGPDCGKWLVNFAQGEIEEVGRVKYEHIYAPMIACVGLLVLFGFLFGWIDSGRYSPLGNLFYQRRVGRWKGDNYWGWFNILTQDAWPTFVDLLWGELLLIAVYLGACVAFLIIGYIRFDDVGKSGDLVWGHLAAVNYAFVLLPVAKNSVLAWLFKSSFERLVKFHRMIGRLALVCLYVHLITMLAQRGASVAYDEEDNKWGLVSLIAFSVATVIAFEPLRRRVWSLFIWVHISTTIVGYVFACLHTRFMWWFSIGPIFLWMLDVFIRTYLRPLYLHPATLVASRVIVEEDPTQLKPSVVTPQGGKAPLPSKPRVISLLELDVAGHPDFEAGAYFFLNIPQLSLTEYHPISVSNYPVEASKQSNGMTRLTFHILDTGKESGWTHKLRLALEKRELEGGAKAAPLTVRVDGPYGHLQVDLAQYRTIVLIGGGIGITPMLSILDFLCQRLDARDPAYAGLSAVHLFWSSRLMSSFEWSAELLQRVQRLHADRIKLHLFVWAGSDPVPKVVQESTKKVATRNAGLPWANPTIEMTRGPSQLNLTRGASQASINRGPGPLAAPVHIDDLDPEVGAEPSQVRFHINDADDDPTAAPFNTDGTTGAGTGSRRNSRPSVNGGDRRVNLAPVLEHAGGILPPETADPIAALDSLVTIGLANFEHFFQELDSDCNILQPGSLHPDHVAAFTGVMSHSVCVLACGPKGLVADVQRRAQAHGYHFHKESFDF